MQLKYKLMMQFDQRLDLVYGHLQKKTETCWEISVGELSDDKVSNPSNQIIIGGIKNILTSLGCLPLHSILSLEAGINLPLLSRHYFDNFFIIICNGYGNKFPC
jgi:hypothetical protein